MEWTDVSAAGIDELQAVGLMGLNTYNIREMDDGKYGIYITFKETADYQVLVRVGDKGDAVEFCENIERTALNIMENC